MNESGTFLEYELAYRRERMMEAGHGHKARRARRVRATRPAARRQQR